MPTDKVDVTSVATPLLKVRAPPRGNPLSKNWTEPVGMPLPGAVAVTVAVNVTLCPNPDGVPEVVNAVEVFALLTTWFGNEPVLALKLASLE